LRIWEGSKKLTRTEYGAAGENNKRKGKEKIREKKKKKEKRKKKKKFFFFFPSSFILENSRRFSIHLQGILVDGCRGQ